MGGLTSIYLDVFRFSAAIGVFLFHSEHLPVSSHVLPYVYFNHQLVIIFFVLSGYVIAASADRPDRTLANYSADRLARLYSVVVPALFLTYLLDAIGSRISPEVYATVNPHWQSIRLAANLVYCQQLWFLCLNPSSNNPFWSLGYEFWYYVFFGVFIFVRTNRIKILWLTALTLLVGPKILLLAPAWAAGALAYYAGKKFSCRRLPGLFLFVLTGLVVIGCLVFQKQLGLDNGKVGRYPLYYSYNFIGDDLFALMVSANFFACCLFSRHLAMDLEAYRITKFIRWLAGHTFSLYLYHVPLLFFMVAVTRYNTRSPVEVMGAICATLVIIVGLSKITEEQYPAFRAYARRFMARKLEKIHSRAVQSTWLTHPGKN